MCKSQALGRVKIEYAYTCMIVRTKELVSFFKYENIFWKIFFQTIAKLVSYIFMINLDIFAFNFFLFSMNFRRGFRFLPRWGPTKKQHEKVAKKSVTLMKFVGGFHNLPKLSPVHLLYYLAGGKFPNSVFRVFLFHYWFFL